MAVPDWLDEQFISNVLSKDVKTDVEISKMTIKPAVPPGNNYLSNIFRVLIEFKIKTTQTHVTTTLIVKAPMVLDSNKDIPEEFDFFAKEPKIYKELLPNMSEKINYDFGPKFYPSQVENAVVLQDLKEEGYSMRSRFDQLDFEHCKEVYKTVAKFHAVSLQCMKENPGLKSLGVGPPMDEEDPMVKRMKSGLMYSARRVAEITKDMVECKGFSEQVLSTVDHLWENISDTFAPKDGKFNVMLHGDLWTTNVMFKYDNKGKIENVKLLDYQLTRIGSPVSDLNLFLWTSGNSEVRESHLKDLYSLYLDTLNNTLEDLGYEERYSQKEFQQDLKASANYVLSLILHHLALLLADPEDGTFTLEEMDSETENGRQLVERILAGKYYRKVLPTIARQFLAWQSSL